MQRNHDMTTRAVEWFGTLEVSACGLAVLSLACPKHQDFVRSRFRSDFFYLKHCAVAELLETRPERSATQCEAHVLWTSSLCRITLCDAVSSQPGDTTRNWPELAS
jgi:hypothetical protein